MNKHKREYFIKRAAILWLLVSSIVISAQKNEIPVLQADAINKDQIYGVHQIKKGEHIFQISQKYGKKSQDVTAFNGLTTAAPVQEHQLIRIPVASAEIRYEMSDGVKFRLMYQVKPGETLYGIVKTKFGLDLKRVQSINGQEIMALKPGMEILIGYFQPQMSVVQNIVDNSQDDEISDNDISEEIDMVPVTEKVIGQWDRQNQSSKGMFVLFNGVPAGEEVEIYFPMRRRTVRAEVIGKLPEGTYAPEVKIFVSPLVARKLGLFDARFMAEIRYMKPVSSI
jgi:LysM repeat protein